VNNYIRDSGKYRTPTQHEVDEIIKLRRLIEKTKRDGDANAQMRFAEAMRLLLATMEIKK
jgi:hypothetical protein